MSARAKCGSMGSSSTWWTRASRRVCRRPSAGCRASPRCDAGRRLATAPERRPGGAPPARRQQETSRVQPRPAGGVLPGRPLARRARLVRPVRHDAAAGAAVRRRPAGRGPAAHRLANGVGHACADIGRSTALAPPLYRYAIADVHATGFSDVQIAAIVLAFGALVLALPLFLAQSQARTLHLADLRQAALSAELKALQAQIEPHFLYNTLANTRYLARHDPDKAVQMLDHLIAYLHSALPDMRRAMSTLEREFTLAEHYLALMAIRFGARLSYRLDYPPELGAATLPPLMLMSLVENAVRHGVEPKPGAVHVAVSAAMDGERLCIVVQDDGAGLQAGVLGNGVGLRNLRQRLEALYAGRATFALLGADGHPTRAQLHLPLQTNTVTTTDSTDE